MLLSDFDYPLDPARIAQVPIEPRDAARLLDATGEPPVHRHVRDLPALLGPGDVVIVNSTKVIPARLHLRRAGGGAAEVLLLERRADGPWSALVRPSKKLAPGAVLTRADKPPSLDGTGSAAVVDEARVVVGEVLEGGRRLVRFVDADGEPLPPGREESVIAAMGVAPLPPYITAPLADAERYQTVYADRPGSVAAPTAGLHLTDATISALRAHGVEWHEVDLVVGLDTFRPITVDDPDTHVMHSEAYSVRAATMAAIDAAHGRGNRVLAVGTTTLRALESAARGELVGRTDIFIRPGHRFATADRLLTNFHLPRSTLLLMVEAFTGPRWRELYALAQEQAYRFLSFGDAMLLPCAAGPPVRRITAVP